MLIEACLEAVSSYLGHQSIDRTWITYRDKNKVLLPIDEKKVVKLKNRNIKKRTRKVAVKYLIY